MTSRNCRAIIHFTPSSCFISTKQPRDYTPLLIVASEAEKPVAKLLAAVRKSVRLFPPAIIKRCEVYGTGEYFDETIDKEFVFGEMLQRLTAEALREAFLIEFRNLENSLFGYKSFRKNHYFAINWLRVRNSLHSIEHVESRFSPSRIRQIKKGLKNGAEVKEAHTPEEVHAFSQMLHHVYSSKILPSFPQQSVLLTHGRRNDERGTKQNIHCHLQR